MNTTPVTSYFHFPSLLAPGEIGEQAAADTANVQPVDDTHRQDLLELYGHINRSPTIGNSDSTDSMATAVDLDNGQIVSMSKAAVIMSPRTIRRRTLSPIIHTTRPGPDIAAIGHYLDALFKDRYLAMLEDGFRQLKIVAVIGSNDIGCRAYAKTIERCCSNLGVAFERKELESRGTFENARKMIEEINGREDVDGLIVLTPIFGGSEDERLRGYIAPHLDIEALSPEMASRCIAATPIPFQRSFETEVEVGKQVSFPCTPMTVATILMSMGTFWNYNVPAESALEGRKITIYNRSAVFGQPLAQMLANAGAIVYSIDINDIILLRRADGEASKSVESTNLPVVDGVDQPTKEETEIGILGISDVIISAVPSPNFKVPNVSMKSTVGLINVATGDNFSELSKREAKWYVPLVGSITRRCLVMNALMGRMKRDRDDLIEFIVKGGTRHEER